MKYYVYIVRCVDNSLYTGIALNIEKRISEHNSSKLGAKALRGKKPVILVFSQEFDTKSQALKRESEIKSWAKVEKEYLITRT